MTRQVIQKLTAAEAVVLKTNLRDNKKLYGAYIYFSEKDGWCLNGTNEQRDIAETILADYYKKTLGVPRSGKTCDECGAGIPADYTYKLCPRCFAGQMREAFEAAPVAPMAPVEGGAEAVGKAYREAFAAGWKACAEAIADKHEGWALLCEDRASMADVPGEAEEREAAAFRHRTYARLARGMPVEYPNDTE